MTLARLTCPRCGVALHHKGAGDAVVAHGCATCEGVFIDGPELMTVCRTLAHLPERRQEVALAGFAGGGIATCPRCEAKPYMLVVLDVEIDFCVRCTGVWLDGPEVAPMGVDLNAVPRRAVGGYRQIVQEQVLAKDIPCGACAGLTPIADAYVTTAGYLCKACFQKSAAADLELRSKQPLEHDKATADAAVETLGVASRRALEQMRAPSFFEALLRWLLAPRKKPS